jgi:putative phage-type endonuclease
MNTDRAAWLAARRKGMGGTDIRAIVCPNKYESPLTVFLEKIGRGLEDDAGWPAIMGNALEGPIADWYARTTGEAVETMPSLVGREPWMLANVDRRVRGQNVILEIKRPTGWTRHEWADGIPTKYVVQATWYLHLLEWPEAKIVAGIGDHEPVIYPLAYDPELGVALEEAGRRFWFDHVLTGTPPTADGSEATSKALAALYARPTKKVLAPTPDDRVLAVELARARREIKALQERERELRNVLCERIGDADRIEGIASWSLRKGSVSWAEVAKAAGITAAEAEKFRGEPTRTFKLLCDDTEED